MGRSPDLGTVEFLLGFTSVGPYLRRFEYGKFWYSDGPPIGTSEVRSHQNLAITEYLNFEPRRSLEFAL